MSMFPHTRKILKPTVCGILSIAFPWNALSAVASDEQPTAVTTKKRCGHCGGVSTAIKESYKAADVNTLLKAIERDPKNASHHLSLGFYYKEQGLGYPALEEFQTARQLDPNNSMPLIGQSQAYAQLRQYDQAEKIIDEGSNQFKESNEFPILRYLLLVQEGRNQQADDYIREIAAKQQNPDLLMFYASILVKNKEYKSALALCDRVINQEKSNGLAILVKASILNKLGRESEELTVISQLFDNMPYSEQICTFTLKYMLRKRLYAGALEPALALLAIKSPTDADYVRTKMLALQLLALTPVDSSEKVITKVTGKLPNKTAAPSFQETVGNLCDKLGRTDLAMQHYLTAAYAPGAGWQQHNKAAFYAETKALDWRTAIPQYKEASKLASGVQQANLLSRAQSLEARLTFLDNDLALKSKLFLVKAINQKIMPFLLIKEILQSRAQQRS